MEWPFVRLRYPLWVVVVFLLFVMNMKGSESCLEEERLGLLELKAFLNSNSSSDKLPSWVDDSDEANCCAWERVKCNHTTKHIRDLLLGDATFVTDVWLMNFSYFSPFKQLVGLDLSHGNFHGWVDIEGLCGMKNLQELDLSRNVFTGNLPQCLGHLTGLRVLDLSSNFFTGSVPAFINSLKSLEYLSLFHNNFDGSFSFSSLSNHSKLEVFLLSPTSNNLHVETENPSWLPKFQLRLLQLRNCNLNSKRNGTIPSFLLYQRELRLIDLSHNKLAGEFPSWLLQNNTKLETLYLINNSFTGTLEVPIFNHALLDLQISNNNIGGQLPDNIGEIFPTLLYVNLSRNSFEGTLPSSMSEMQTIRTLDLSYNNFSGELTGHMFSDWTSLILLRLSHNSFHGPVIPMFSNLTRLGWLYLDHNSFSGEIGYGVSDKSSLYALDISNNMISGRIPRWISSFESLRVLSLSKNQLEGSIPNELCNLSLAYLDLSENNLSGSLPSCFDKFRSMRFLYLQKNSLQGYMPHALSNLTSLVLLDLRDNNFFGNIPKWINMLSQLRALLLAGNKLTGTIPNEMCQLEHVKIMDLSRNWLIGAIPSCFSNISFQMVHSVNLGAMFPADAVPEFRTGAMPEFRTGAMPEFPNGAQFRDDVVMGSVNVLQSLFIVDQVWFFPLNTFHTFYNCTLTLNDLVGDVYMISYEQAEVEFRAKSYYHTYEGNILDLMTGLDLSSNELSGNIPPEIGELREIFALNLSHNQLSGYIPGSFYNLTSIESLDLSYNNLNGAIPLNLTGLYSLAIFNVSYNNLSGMVPITGQFATFDENNYRGNSYLCGETLNISCTSTSYSPPTHTNESAEDHTAIVMGSFYWSFVASYVTVVLGLAIVLWVNSHWCRAWFRFVDLCIFSSFSRCLKNAFHR